MRKAWRLFKAVMLAITLISALLVVVLVLAWTKGLFLFLLAFGIIVWALYTKMERRDYDRNWRQRNADWRNYK